MAYLFRLIVAVLSLVAGSAHALVPQVQSFAIAGTAVFRPTPAQACDDGLVAYAQVYQVVVTGHQFHPVGDNGNPGCGIGFTRLDGSSYQEAMVGFNSGPLSCPANSTPSESQCQCAADYVDNAVHTACVPKPRQCASKAGTTYTEATSQSFPGTINALPVAAAAAMDVQPPNCAGSCSVAPVGSPVLTQEVFSAGGANAVAGGAVQSWSGYNAGVWTVNFPKAVYTGGDCTASNSDLTAEQNWRDEIDKGNAAPSPPAPGKCPGTVNGTTVYVPCGATATSSSSSSSSSGNSASSGGSNGSTNGSGPGGSGGTNGNGSGSGSSVIDGAGSGGVKSNQTAITVCDGKQCTTTTTVKSTASGAGGAGGSGSGSGGNGTSTEDCAAKAATSAASAPAGGNTGATCTKTTSTTQTISDYCKDNPKAVQCTGTQSSFGGNCKAGFSAKSDDAVLNAMAKEQFERNCQLLASDGIESAEIAGEMAKTGNRTGDSGNNSTVDVGPSSFDTTNVLGGGGCNLDKQITVWRGYSVTLPFSNACNFLLWLGNLGVACSLLLAARIVARG